MTTALLTLTLWLAAAAASVPTHESVLGFTVGADFHLASYDESIAYFRALDEASDELELRQVGETSEGRPFYFQGSHAASASGAEDFWSPPERPEPERDTDSDTTKE